MKCEVRWFGVFLIVTSLITTGIFATTMLSEEELIFNDSPLYNIRNSNANEKDMTVNFDYINEDSEPYIDGTVGEIPFNRDIVKDNKNVDGIWTIIQPWCDDNLQRPR